MGMSASQARFLSLTARKNNVEFEGQQINQQRTTLSNESASYYGELCNMEVPTPPSIDDYTKVSYTFNDGAMTNTIISLLPKIDSNGKIVDNKYAVNYIEEWQDDYAIVPAASSLVQVDNPDSPTKFNIGSSQLRKIENLTDEQINALSAEELSAKLGNDEYGKNLSEEQMKALLKNESYYLKMIQSETDDNGDFYIRYVKNSTTGNYEPYFYAESELTNYQKYNDKNLGSIPCYTLGSTTRTREVLNQECTIEQDSSGRYVAISIIAGKTSETIKVQTGVKDPTPEEIAIWEGQKPKMDDYMTQNTDNTLYKKFAAASQSCYVNAVSSSAGCYIHVIAHMLDLTLNAAGTNYDPNAYPKYYKSSASNSGNDVELLADNIPSNINSNGQTPNMKPVSDAIRDGWKVGGVTYPVMTTTPTKYNTEEMTAEALKYFSDEYIKQDNPTDAQKLLSNYYKDPATGDIKNKSLRQKCIDVLKILKTDGYYGIDYTNVLVPLLKSMQQDMENFSLFDEGGYGEAIRKWQESYPPQEPVYEEQLIPYEDKRLYTLTTKTTTDEEAYNDAMNQYNYKQHEYDQKIQEINSKLKIVQQQDKMLELKIKQLDTEENAISTEMDAVKKVISKNVESSFKTFNA